LAGWADRPQDPLPAKDTALADPGRTSYDLNPARLGTLATPAHNTIHLDGFNHRPYEDGEPPLAHVTQWQPRADGSVLPSAHHTAYDHLWGRPVVRRQIFFDGDGLFVLVDRVDCAQEGAGQREHGFLIGLTLPDKDAAEIDTVRGWARTTFADGPNLFLRTLDRGSYHQIFTPSNLWRDTNAPGRKGALRETVRISPCKNADRAWMAHVLKVSGGPAEPVEGEAAGQTRGTVHVTVRDGRRELKLAFEPDRVLGPAGAK